MKQMADKTSTGVNQLKEGSFVILDGVPCRVTRVQISTSGKHGHAKVRLDATGLMDGVNRSIIKPSHDDVEVPIILKKRAQVLAILPSGQAQLMDMESFETMEMDIPDDRKDEIVPPSEVDYFEVLDIKTLKKIK
jgi:translation initiation factor 5A